MTINEANLTSHHGYLCPSDSYSNLTLPILKQELQNCAKLAIVENVSGYILPGTQTGSGVAELPEREVRDESIHG